MTLDEAREIYESMEGPGDETVRQVDWDADIQKLMDTVNAAVEAERQELIEIIRTELKANPPDGSEDTSTYRADLMMFIAEIRTRSKT